MGEGIRKEAQRSLVAYLRAHSSSKWYQKNLNSNMCDHEMPIKLSMGQPANGLSISNSKSPSVSQWPFLWLLAILFPSCFYLFGSFCTEAAWYFSLVLSCVCVCSVTEWSLLKAFHAGPDDTCSPPHSIKHSGKQIKQKNPQEQQKPKKQNPKTKQLTNPNYTVPTVGKIHLWGWISSVASFKHSETG